MGEIIEWSGFALMCWNLPALSFAVWTAANLIPRALSHHAWYRRTFPDYPPGRKAVIPGAALVKRPNFDVRAARYGGFPPPLHCLVHARTFEDPESADVLLGFDIRPVADR